MTTTTYPIITITSSEGTDFEFSQGQIIDGKILQEINPVSIEVPSSTLEFTAINPYSAFQMFAGETYELLSQRLPVVAYESVDGTNLFLGKFYLSSWKNLGDTKVEFQAIDMIGVLAEMMYDGGFWETATSLDTILDTILGQVGVEYNLDSSLDSVELSGWIPPCTYREALQHICFAAGAVAKTSRSSVIEILPTSIPDTTYSQQVTDSEKSSDQSVELLPLVTLIELVSHTYTQGEDLEEIFSKYLDVGNYKIVFEKPYQSVVISGPGYIPTTFSTEAGADFLTEAGDNFEIGAEYVFGPNCLYLYVTTAGTVTVSGYPWLDSKRSFIFTEDVAVEFANKNTKQITDATLISLTNAQEILNNLRDYYRQRYVQNMLLFSPNVDLNTIIRTSTSQSKELIGIARKSDISLAGGGLENLEILGSEYVPS